MFVDKFVDKLQMHYYAFNIWKKCDQNRLKYFSRIYTKMIIPHLWKK